MNLWFERIKKNLTPKSIIIGIVVLVILFQIIVLTRKQSNNLPNQNEFGEEYNGEVNIASIPRYSPDPSIDTSRNREIFTELVAQENQIQLEAEQLYPIDRSQSNWQDNSTKQAQYRIENMKTVRQQISDKYNIPENLLDIIHYHGVNSEW